MMMRWSGRDDSVTVVGVVVVLVRKKARSKSRTSKGGRSVGTSGPRRLNFTRCARDLGSSPEQGHLKTAVLPYQLPHIDIS